MAVAATVRHSLSSRQRLYQPKGLQVWRAAGSVAGDVSGGNVVFTLNLNPDSSPVGGAWAITECVCYAGAAAVGEVRITESEWLEPQEATPRVETVNGTTFYARLVTPSDPVNLGQVNGAVPAAIVVIISVNTNGVTHSFRMRGWYATEGFLVPRLVVP